MAIPQSSGRSLFKYFQFDEGRDSPSEVRNVLLIVASLIAAVTFQAGVNPPGAVWQDDDKRHVANQKYYVAFLIANTVAFSSAVLVILFLTHRFPFYFEMIVATICMFLTYVFATFAATPDMEVTFCYVLFAAGAPPVTRVLIEMYKKLKQKYGDRN